MAELRFSFLIFLLVPFLGLCESNEIGKSTSETETISRGVEDPVLDSKKTKEGLDGKNAISQLMSDSTLFSTENIGEQIVRQKVLEIVKNPVNVDLNKLPIDVIEKIAEGGVTTPKAEAKALVTDEKKLEPATEEAVETTNKETKTTAVTEEEPRTAIYKE